MLFPLGLNARPANVVGGDPSPRIVHVQGTTLANVLVSANGILQNNPPTQNGVTMLFLDAFIVGASTHRYEIALVFAADGGFPPSQVQITGYEGTAPPNLDVYAEIATSEISALNRKVIGYAGGGASEHALLLVFSAPGDFGDMVPGIDQTVITLVGGTATHNTNVKLSTKAYTSLVTPGGTLGTHYRTTVTPGLPGNVQVQAVDTAGVLVVTDTSTLNLLLVNLEQLVT